MHVGDLNEKMKHACLLLLLLLRSRGCTVWLWRLPFVLPWYFSSIFEIQTYLYLVVLFYSPISLFSFAFWLPTPARVFLHLFSIVQRISKLFPLLHVLSFFFFCVHWREVLFFFSPWFRFLRGKITSFCILSLFHPFCDSTLAPSLFSSSGETCHSGRRQFFILLMGTTTNASTLNYHSSFQRIPFVEPRVHHSSLGWGLTLFFFCLLCSGIHRSQYCITPL